MIPVFSAVQTMVVAVLKMTLALSLRTLMLDVLADGNLNAAALAFSCCSSATRASSRQLGFSQPVVVVGLRASLHAWEEKRAGRPHS